MRASPKVLVVDDHEPTRDGLRALLEQAGYTVSTASDGSDGLRLFKGDSPDLVLLDVNLGTGRLCGVEAHRDTCLTPVILISAVGDRDSQLAGLKAGADDFLNKPVDLEELYARVRSLLRIKRLTDDLESAELLFLSLGRIVEAREIVKVVDIFDALTTHRPYRRAMSRVKALQILRQEARTG
jgi:putative two-component system response regulator